MKTFTVQMSPAGICKQYPQSEDGQKCFEFIDSESIEVRDEYHSFHELYEHRMALNIALCHSILVICGLDSGMIETIRTFKSKLHSDGTMFDGYFIVMIVFKGKQISYHYKLKHWDKFQIPEVERCPEYDGHTSKDVLERLMKL